jgi:hypothetical protein
VTEDHNRIVTPYTDPARFDEEDRELFDAGQCTWQTGFGLPWTEVCGQPSKPGASFGYCAEHEAELLEEHYLDGTPRHRTAEEWRAAQHEAER